MKLFSTCLMRPVYLVVILMLLNGCEKNNEYKPLGGTEEYRRLHGIQEDKESIIAVGQRSFRLPPDLGFEVRTDKKIESGKADKIIMYIPIIQDDKDQFRIEITVGYFPDAKPTKFDEKDFKFSSNLPKLV